MSRFREKFGMGLVLLSVCLIGGACRQDMQDQPKMKPYRSTSFFGDGLAMRQPVAGTIPRGYLRSASVLFTGKKEKSAQSTPSPSPASGNQNPYGDDTDTFPFPITEETMQRGRERFEIF